MSNRPHRTISLLVCALVVLLASVSLLAQGAPEGRIVGVVHDPTGAVIANATITVINEGTNAKQIAKASADGGFAIPSLTPGAYRVEVAADGFATAVFTDVQVEPSRERSLTAVLKIGKTAEVVEVTAGQELVNTTTTEVSKTVNTQQIQNLPRLGLDIITLLSTQAGAGSSGRTYTTINGNRPSWSQVTLDGINIQDPYIRTNALDYIPNRPTSDTVQEFTVSSSTQGVDAALGSGGVRMVTTSGSNSFHGGAWEYNRNSAFAANSWFRNNNVPITSRPFRNRNEFGGKFGGPILKNKLFFFGAFTDIIDRQAAQLNQTIPLHDDYLTGVFRYVRPSDNTIQSMNVLSALSGVTLDPKIKQILSTVPAASNVNNYNVGDSTATKSLNRAGFMQNQGNNYDRKSFQIKMDYELSAKHHFDGYYSQMHEVTQRPGYDPLNLNPAIFNDSHPKFGSLSWRWTISNSFINNLRAGANIVDAPFASKLASPSFLLAEANTESNNATYSGIGISPQQVSFQPQGRQSNQYQLLDDATWIKGNHSIKFGTSYSMIRLFTWNERGTMPTLTTGFSTAAPKTIQLTAANFPGASISSTDLTAANNLRAFLGGVLSSEAQTFQATSTTSGFVNGAPNLRRLPMSDFMFYGQDQWRVRPNITVNYGLKWEYLTPYKEKNGIALGPMYTGNSNIKQQLLDPNMQIGFLKQGWNPDRNNFAPTVGIAWDPMSDGKTSVRFGYSLAFVNDEQYRFAGNAADTNAGLNSAVSVTGLYTTLGTGVPTVPTPAFKVPRTLADQIAVSSTGALWALDPNAQMPKVHEISFGVERELRGNMSLEVRYVGTLGRGLLRGIDLNQSNSGSNQAYLDDFTRARNNGYLAQAAGKGFDPRYNSSVAGSQVLTFIPTIANAMSYMIPTYSTTVGYLQTNQAAALADWFTYNRSTFTNAPQTFLPNPAIYAVDYGSNAAFSSYHGMQAELNKRYKNGLQFQTNYTWSKLLSDAPYSDGNQTRFDPLLDNARPGLMKARGDFDIRHALKANAVYDLPFGKGKMFLGGANGVVDRIIGGWQLSGIYTLQSGNPFTIYSSRATFNRRVSGGAGYYFQTAVSSIPQNNIKKYLGVYRDPNGGMWYISPGLTDPNTGRAVGPDTQSQTAAGNFNQIFSNPTAGNIGNLGILAFDAPAYTDLDLGIGKSIKVNERFGFKFRADMFNAPNHPTFYFGDRDVNSTSFGKITSTNTSARVVQFSLRLDF
jgi:hypothetical protein